MIVAQITMHSGAAGLRVAGPLLLLQVGAPTWQVGVLLACFSIGPLLIAWRVGLLVDRRGYRPPMQLALALSLAAALGAFAASFAGESRFVLLCVAAAIGGAGVNAGLITMQRTAARMASDPAALRRNFGWVGMAPPAANVVGPVAAGVLLDVAGAHGALLAMVAFPLLGWALARAVRAPAPPDAAAPRSGATVAGLLAQPAVRRMMVVDCLMIAAWDVHALVVPVLGHERGLSASVIGGIYGLFAVGVFLARGAIPLLAERLHESRVLIASMLGTAFVFAVYPLGASAWYMAACALVLGATLGFAQPMILTTLHRAVPEGQRGGVLALRTMWINGAAMGMPIGFAAGAAAVGWTTMLWLLAAAIGGGSRAARGHR